MARNHYQEFAPPADLRDIVACTWVRVVGPDAASGLSAIIPDGCADILVYDDAPPFVVGPDATTRWTTLSEGTVITGIRLRPGAVRATLGCEARLILDSGAFLSDVAPGAKLHRQLLTSARLRERHALLEDWVRQAVARVAPSDHAIVAACRWLTADPHLEISELARRLGWSARTIHRQFLAACGYGPKHLQRIMRIQQALRAAHAVQAPRLSDVAHASGYADQAHMTRDFRDITGFTPAGYFAIARPGVGAWIEERW
jgi:AraC-like DNA-binding protein